MYLPDGLLTSGFYAHDVGPDQDYITVDPFASDDCLDVFSPVYQFLQLEPEELNTMNPSEDEPSSGLNGRLRPRKNAIPSSLSIKQIVSKYDGKQTQEKPKRSSTPSKASQSKTEDLRTNSNPSPTPQLLCPYCDRKFGSKQNVSKHIRRFHFANENREIVSSMVCLFCNHVETEPSDIIRHMIDSHPNQYVACLDCHTRFPSTKELAEHKLNICEKLKITYRSKLRRKTTKKSQKALDLQEKQDYSGHSFNGIVISCELKPAHIHDEADIEDNITTNLILPPSKNISASAVLEKNAVIVLDDIQWNRRIPSNFSFHNTDADQILSRLGVVHRSPKTGESTKKDWFRAIEDATQKFEKCFDTSFYSKVASNVQENLTKFLDGSFNFNPDADSTIKTRKSKNSVVINTAEGFPILLACEQFSRNTYDGYIPRTIAPKHKWKWDNLENEKLWNPDQIKRDTHANNCIITLVSSLDIWTQLCMRRKFENKFDITPVEKKTEKQNVISKELKEILESREIPTSNSQISKYINNPLPITNGEDFPTSLGLMPCVPKFNVKPAILSGEWVRPRCYVCCACGAQSRDSRALSLHVSSKHPNAQVQHYEIVGESLLKADILKHLYVPPNHNVNRTRPPRGFRDCTKCMKSITIEDLHQHMLDCAGDTPAVRRKCRYRPFGVRRRRPRLPDNRIRKKMRNDIRTRPTRQKNRMRTKPKIRTEVGDAETIRKMLADLPAKRHRVLVNPLNSILRPRRKLDKQRALMMLKRHTSEDVKGKPKQGNKILHFDQQSTSSYTDRYKSTIREDEDNEPLKPRLKRVACKITRQKESMTRKGMLKKPKRKVRIPIEKAENEDVEEKFDVPISCTFKVQTDELSVDQNQKRINVNQDPENSRENSSGRGDPNNGRRDNQRPGSSEQNDNSRNVCAPAQNVPLKHSIARLTANSETHDKSVQFHHLFLVQQECNNTNEHVPSGQRILFENEAVVTKLDKPPLHFNQNISIEAAQEPNADTVHHNLESIHAQTLDSIQKNKLNKPRKGLNDCIAMLKNKLVDTDPNVPAHVSVQCGTDDILSPDPGQINISTLISPRVDIVMKSTQVIPSTKQPKRTLSNYPARTEQLPKPSPLYRAQYLNNDDLYANFNVDRQSTQWRPVNYDAIMPRFINNPSRKETSRRRSISQHENLLFAQQLLSVTPPNDDMLIKLSTEPYNHVYNLTPRKSPKNYPEQFNVDSNILSKYRRRKISDKNTGPSNGSVQYCGKIVNNQNRKSTDSCKKSANSRTRVSTPKKPIETLEKNLNIRKDVSKNTKATTNEKYQSKAFDCQLHREIPTTISEERKNEMTPQVIKRKRRSNVNSEITLSQFKQAELQVVADVNVKLPINAYSEQNLNDNVVSIPLAHASTNIESILSVPLDLSSKAISVETDYSSTYDSTLLTEYDRYETLDLSNKRRTSMEDFCVDEVVDLRIKHNSEYPQLPTLKSPCPSIPQQEPCSMRALNLAHKNQCVPTDLSLKRKGENLTTYTNLSQNIVNLDETEIQDLSRTKTKNTSTADRLVHTVSVPKDLSNKNTKVVDDITLLSKESNKSNSDTTFVKCKDPSDQHKQSDLSGKPKAVDNEINDSNPRTGDNQVTSEESNKNQKKIITPENINYEDEALATTDASMTDSISHIQKPLYDPTLRIPQYKIKPVESDTVSREMNDTTSSSVSVMTCVENCSPHQPSTSSSTHLTSRSHNSSVVNSSTVAFIDAKEGMTCSFPKSLINTVASTVTGSLPTYSLLNRGITTPFTTFGSTRPVYALPNACISMTKIDVTSNSLLSIPSTTIVSTTPVYTLAGTTLATPLNYATLPNNGQSIPFPPPCGTYLPEIDSQIMTHYTVPNSVNIQEGRPNDNNIFIRSSMFNFDRDQDILGSFMLPKDIMAILNAMPEDHRNHLFILLSPYISTLRPIPVLSAQAQSLFQNPGPSILTMPVRLPRELTVDASTDTVDIKSWDPTPTVDGQCRMQQNVKSSKPSLNSASAHSESDSDSHNQVIDLTYDEVIPKIDLDSEVNDNQEILSKEETLPSIASVSNVPKSNDKTASLRAVRIKAPSERQQLKIITNPVEILSCTEIPDVPNTDNHDNQLNQFLNIEIPSEIQMYEVSSTQSNKNRLCVGESTYKFPLQPVCNNLIKPLSILIANEAPKDLPSELLKSDAAGTISLDKSLICLETKDNLTGSENIKLNVTETTQSFVGSNLKNTVNNSTPIEPLMIYDLNKDDNDDDSDDNVSLAVIVKQKQINQNKLKVPFIGHEINTSKDDILKDKHAILQEDKVNLPETLSIGDIPETGNNKAEQLTGTDIPIAVKKVGEPISGIHDSERTLGDSYKVKSKQFKKKGKKNHNESISVKKGRTHDKEKIQIAQRETDIKKKNEIILENVDNSQVITLNLNSKQRNVTSGEPIYVISSKEIQKPIFIEMSRPVLTNFEYKNDVQNLKLNDENVIIDIDSLEEQNKTIQVLSESIDLPEAFTQDAIDNNKELINAENLHNERIRYVQQVDKDGSLGDNDEMFETNFFVTKDAIKNLDEEEIPRPLRRSKRGKSLFMEQTLICSDTCLEQKAPLTKKQLIFSKLLLDEEKHQKISKRVDDNRIFVEENNSFPQAKTDTSEEEIHKSVKRKKSPHLNRKYKKKKSAENFEHIISDDETAKTLVMEIDCSKKDSEVNFKENLEGADVEVSVTMELESKVLQSKSTFDIDNNNKVDSNEMKIMPDQNNPVSGNSVKRKIDPLLKDHLETNIHSSKPKKSKSNNANDILGISKIQMSALDVSHNTSANVPLAGRRARSKSVVVKSSGSMLYDPYDIDLEDMGDETQPFRKQISTLLRSGTNKLAKENHLETTCTTSDNVTNAKAAINLDPLNSTIAIPEKDSNDTISDSDESSKSDVPLKKYVEEKVRKNQLCDSGNIKFMNHNVNEEIPSNDDDMKPSKKKHKKNKRSQDISIENVQKEHKYDKEVSEEQRSEQFMESFGFFSERKPRKSNLLATKKISETFHIIANESDDIYMDAKERPSKKGSRSESKKSVDEENNPKHPKTSDLPKLPSKCDKNLRLRSATLYCHLCKKEFRRIDNLVRHQMTLFHASKLSENALNVAPPDDFNYLVIFKEHIDRLRILEQKMKSKKQPKTKFIPPTLHQILLDVRKSVREKQLARRNLSRDQALFLDCCELLKDSNRSQTEDRDISRPLYPCCPSSYALACTRSQEYDPKSGLSLEFSRYAKCDPIANLVKKPIIHTSARLSGMADFVPLSSISKQASSTNRNAQPSTSTKTISTHDPSCKDFAQSPKLDVIEEITDEKDDSKSDGDVDSITAKTILESEEVRILEHDLISGLKEAACKFQPLVCEDKIAPESIKRIHDSGPEVQIDMAVKKDCTPKVKCPPDAKEKKQFDIIENIDMFEDKFDKIKRKCRSQAAAAKLVQTSVEPSVSHKRRKKSDKKKGKRNSKKHNPSTVLTKGALKGYDSIKVSILTSEIDLSAIVPSIITSSKKKKKRNSKKKRDKKRSIPYSKEDSISCKDSSNKDIDVYEFLDNEEPEIFELRPSTVMERFRNLNKKDVQSSSKMTSNQDDAASTDSASDGDDFVYMSDDYVCSDDETENSLMSCELGNVKGTNDVKKSLSPLKRKDVMEKNAVMGKIFKNNAVRPEKKNVKPKESTKSKANLDQLFDSLLEDEPNSSAQLNNDDSPEKDTPLLLKKRVFSPVVLSKYDLKPSIINDSPKKNRSPSPALSSDSAVSRRISSFSSRQSSPRGLSSSRYDIASPCDYERSSSKEFDDLKKCDRILKDYELPATKKHDRSESTRNNNFMNENIVLSPESDIYLSDSNDKSTKDIPVSRKKEKVAEYETCYDFKPDFYDDDAFSDDAGVARQRARRKCTVGKQNILAETWSSESELDSVPPRPNSAESVVLNVARKRKGKKRDGQSHGGRKGNKHVSVKKQDFESRVSSSNRNIGISSGVAGTSRSSGGSSAYSQQLSLPGPSGMGPRLRPSTSFWADGDEEPEHVQQHGWIVGDSHKKLVTMLAHAKGRKRNNDDKVRLME